MHGLAVTTFVMALPLVFLGAEVTTKEVGMVDLAPIRWPWFFLTEFFSGVLRERGMGWIVEHGHRQVGWIVGLLAIACAAAAFLTQASRAAKLLSVLALAAICVQGALGIFRVQLNDLLGKTLSLVHGAFAQVVFGLLLALVLATGRRWFIANPNPDKLPWLRRWGVATTAAMLLQTVLGGLIRHKNLATGARLHLLGAFVVFAFVFVAIKFARETDYASFKLSARVLMGLLTIQVVLGAEAWMAWMKRYFAPETALTESTAIQLMRSSHYLVGALLFATMAALTAKALWAPREAAA